MKKFAPSDKPKWPCPPGVGNHTRTLSRETVEAIMRVEGHELTAEQRELFDDFDRRGLSHDERRKIIRERYGRPQ